MRVDILYFAWMREAVGMAQEVVDVPAEVVTVADLAAWLSTHSEGHAAALGDSEKLRCAVNQQRVPEDQVLLNTSCLMAYEMSFQPRRRLFQRAVGP